MPLKIINSRSFTKVALSIAFAAVTFASVPHKAQAQIKYQSREAILVVDLSNDRILHQWKYKAKRRPASLTKVMTLYLLFEALEKGEVTLDTVMTASRRAASMPSTNIRLKTGEKIKVKDAISALAVRSANDVAVVVAERLGGTERNFAVEMTSKANDLQMYNTQFANASGLHSSRQYTTAQDMYRLARAVKLRFPNHFSVFSSKTFVWKGKTYRNHNQLLKVHADITGLKTGYTRASGYNLLTMRETGDRKIVSVVLGSPSGARRDKISKRNLFSYFGLAQDYQQRYIANGAVQDTAVQDTIVRAQSKTPNTVSKAPRRSSTIVATAGIEAGAELASVDKKINIGELNSKKISRVFSVLELVDASDSPKGWAVQVSASPTPKLASSFLEQVWSKNQSVLKSAKGAVAYVEPLNKSNSMLYRARFGGLGKASARHLCGSIKKNGVECFVTLVR